MKMSYTYSKIMRLVLLTLIHSCDNLAHQEAENLSTYRLYSFLFHRTLFLLKEVTTRRRKTQRTYEVVMGFKANP